MQRRAAEEALELVPYFAGLRADEKVRAARHVEVISLAAGQSIELAEGAPKMFVVVSGDAELVEGDGDAIALYAGDAVGEAEAIAGRGRPATLRASEATTLAALDRAALDAIFDEAPAVALSFVAELGRELKFHNDVLREACIALGAGLSQAQLAEVIRRRRRRLARHRRFSPRRALGLLLRALVVEPGRRPAFWIFVGAASALASARTVVALIIDNGLQSHLFALIGGKVGHPIHVHHFNYGLVLVSAVGLLSLLPRARTWLRTLAFAFGFGVGLVVDEFALLWNLNPDYYQPSSRVAAAVVLFGLAQVVWFGSMYIALAKRLVGWVRS